MHLLFKSIVPGNLLVLLVVKSLYYTICCLAKADYRQVASSIKHVVVVGSPFVAVDDVLLRLVALKLLIHCITSKISFKSFSALRFDVLDYDKSAAMVVFKL